MKNSEIQAPAFFKHNNSFIATVKRRWVGSPKISTYKVENVSLLQQPITMYSQVSVGEINPIVDDYGLPTDMTLN